MSRVFAMPFAKVYPLYVAKAEKKGRTKEEVDMYIQWLTGYDQDGMEEQIEGEADFTAFFAQAPAMNPNASLIKGVGVRCAGRGCRGSSDAENSLLRQASRRTYKRQGD